MRVYAITYRLYHANGGAFKYADNPSYEDRTTFYSFEERQKWIAEYERLKEDPMYYDNVKAFAGDINEVKDMDKIKNAI